MLTFNTIQQAIVDSTTKSISWLFEVNSYPGWQYWSTKDKDFYLDSGGVEALRSYSYKVIPDSFSGITMNRAKPELGIQVPNEVTFQILNTSNSFITSEFQDLIVYIKLIGSKHPISELWSSNSGFETYAGGAQDDGIDNTFTDWTVAGTDGVADASATVQGGSNSVKLTAGATKNKRISYTHTVTAGEHYSWSFYYRGSGVGGLYGRYQVYDVTHSADITATTPTTYAIDTAFRYAKVDFTVPAGCTSIQTILWCPNSDGNSVWYDTNSLTYAEVLLRQWPFRTIRCESYYQLLAFTLEDISQKFIKGDFPKSGLVKDLFKSNHNLNQDNVCVPETFGTCYTPLRFIIYNDNTLNPNDKGANITLSSGNLIATSPLSVSPDSVRSIKGVYGGKYYWEVTATTVRATSDWYIIGIGNGSADINQFPGLAGGDSYGYRAFDGNIIFDGSASAYGSSYVSSDIIGIALDLDNGKIWWRKNNGAWPNAGDPAAGTNPAYSGIDTTKIWYAMVSLAGNEGSTSFTINCGRTSFTYTAPTGFGELIQIDVETGFPIYGERYLLGPTVDADGAPTYTITAQKTPKSYSLNTDEFNTTDDPVATFTQSTILDDYGTEKRVFINDIADGSNAFWGTDDNSYFYDVPTKFSRSTRTSTAPGTIIDSVFDALISSFSSPLNSSSITTANTTFSGWGLTWTGSVWKTEPVEKIIGKLLNMCHSTLISDTINTSLKVLSAVSQKTITNASILKNQYNGYGTFKYSSIKKETYDSGYTTYSPLDTSGNLLPQDELVQILVPVKEGGSTTNPSSEILELPFITSSIHSQRLGIMYFQRRYCKIADISFSAKSSLLALQPDDVITINGTNYGQATLGDDTTQWDVTNPVGTTFRYTYDGTGTDPGDLSILAVGSTVIISSASLFTAANEGQFTITGSATTYFEVTNASGVVESNKTGAYISVTCYNVLIDSISIKKDLTLEFQCSQFSVPLDDWGDLNPTQTTSNSLVAPANNFGSNTRRFIERFNL